jgi:predicted AAA+ superfamily ATPase
VFIELTRRHEIVHYFRSRSADVDFLITRENKPAELIQVSYSINDPLTYSREVVSLSKASRELDCSKLMIITFNEEKTINQNGTVINVLPAWKWLLSTKNTDI